MEAIMCAIVDLNSELLIDRSRVRNPYLKLLLTALGRELIRGSSWVAIDKQVAAEDEFLIRLIRPIDSRLQSSAAAAA
jgi:hypothetical protein